MVLGPLFAAGGDVTVNAGALHGQHGTITAYGGPTITITNNSPDYLVLELDHHSGRAWRPGHFHRRGDCCPAGMHVTESDPARTRL